MIVKTTITAMLKKVKFAFNTDDVAFFAEINETTTRLNFKNTGQIGQVDIDMPFEVVLGKFRSNGTGPDASAGATYSLGSHTTG